MIHSMLIRWHKLHLHSTNLATLLIQCLKRRTRALGLVSLCSGHLCARAFTPPRRSFFHLGGLSWGSLLVVCPSAMAVLLNAARRHGKLTSTDQAVVSEPNLVVPIVGVV
ncbi:hypothetical protein HBH98_097650 [Parastagonospora nodorum]|nr:hypothetical protein HBH53_062400 [Parastagonospora nodorum]KAH4067871.1 hypothetical protein HBH50_133040 [Parastagonospora nodorum]KAH4086970.1 hypothetical protein HBH48_142460 [Parastagonospora nodorum]KAH4090400.1 hypothetical protein HBH46_189910 [Parastagonospora nodorum]KAH4300063.1 hypothetical protein HBI01_109800 [Parastagonospora nodorum]